MTKLKLATSQFLITANVDQNLNTIRRHMKRAHHEGAQLVHFSEACLTGYLGSELQSARECDWDGAHVAMHEVMALARDLKLWTVIGSNHRLSGKNKPHNSLYVVNDQGELVTRYDKMFCCGTTNNNQDLKHYSPGEQFVDFTVRGVKCGLLICHDFRYPELFREYKRRGAHLVLVSFHLAGMKREDYDKYMVTVPATLQAAAASNFLSISSNNGTRPMACPSFVVNPEGMIVDRARAHRNTILVNTIDTKAKLYDASVTWRERAMNGTFHSGNLIKDKRSSARTEL